MTILVIADHDNTTLSKATLNAVSAAAVVAAFEDGAIEILVAGYNVTAVAEQASGIEGVSKVLHADASHLENGLAENVERAVLAVLRDTSRRYSHVVVAATAFGKSIAPRIAAQLDVAQVSDVIAVVSLDTFERPIYAGNAVATVQSMDPVKILTIRTTAFPPAEGTGRAAIETVSAGDDAGMSRYVSREMTKSERPELTAAQIVVSGGRGLGSGENYQGILAPLADKLGAALGASRAAVDAGFAPNNYQVGQTGKIVAPQLYVAVGISGAIQHLAGMKDSKVIVAINRDPEAPIFSVADFAIEGDLFEVVPSLVKALD
jgi:electron transfer flavoprotein alpha subunit